MKGVGKKTSPVEKICVFKEKRKNMMTACACVRLAAACIMPLCTRDANEFGANPDGIQMTTHAWQTKNPCQRHGSSRTGRTHAHDETEDLRVTHV